MTHYYIGDINPEHGGTWYELPSNDDWTQDYAQCVSVTDASGYIDAITSDSLWLIESGSVYMPWEKCSDRLSCIGASILANGDIDDNGTILKAGTQAHWLCYAYACQAYSGIERDYYNGETWLSDDPELTNDDPDTFTIETIEPGALADYIAANHGVSAS